MEVSQGNSSSTPQVSNQSNNAPNGSKPPSDAEMLHRARDAHTHVNFNTLAAGPNAGGPWKRVDAADHFVVFLQDVKAVGNQATDLIEPTRNRSGPEVLCAGRLDACIEEIAAVLRPRGEAEHNAVMTALYSKRFLCGSVERGVPCAEVVDVDGKTVSENGEELVVKTSSFARSALFGSNEQWCYTDFFRRKADRDGFMISQRSLPHDESTPGRMVGVHTRVDQLHDLAAAYLIDLNPGSNGLRVVFNAMFLEQNAADSTIPVSEKAQTRRLLALAGGVTKIPGLIRSRRFGFQVPANLDTINVSNPHCQCCTRSLAPIKMSLSAAASVFSRWSLSPLKMDNRRCYLCGYLVCADCWSAETMESMSGRTEAVIVCTRCQNCVSACNYSDISSDRAHGPARVVEDPPENTTAAVLVDFLADSLAQSPVNSPERSNVLVVVRTFLQHENASEEDEYDQEHCHEQQYDAKAIIDKVDEFLRDEQNLPLLETCTLGNADRRNYALDLPDDPETSVPRGPIPDNEDDRVAAAKASGLLLLADTLAPANPAPDREPVHGIDVRDLELVCELAVRILGCSNAMISIMGQTHEQVLASTDSNFAGAAVPRDYTMCQHQLMSQDPLVLIHPEADVRLQAIETIKLMSLRSYIGFPITAPILDTDNDEIAVGTLCCIDSKPHPELTRSQYATMQNLARTASMLVQQKGLQLQQKAAPAP